MRTKLEIRKKIASEWFRFLQLKICEEFAKIEREKIVKDTNHHFSKKPLGKSLRILKKAEEYII